MAKQLGERQHIVVDGDRASRANVDASLDPAAEKSHEGVRDIPRIHVIASQRPRTNLNRFAVRKLLDYEPREACAYFVPSEDVENAPMAKGDSRRTEDLARLTPQFILASCVFVFPNVKRRCFRQPIRAKFVFEARTGIDSSRAADLDEGVCKSHASGKKPSILRIGQVVARRSPGEIQKMCRLDESHRPINEVFVKEISLDPVYSRPRCGASAHRMNLEPCVKEWLKNLSSDESGSACDENALHDQNGEVNSSKRGNDLSRSEMIGSGTGHLNPKESQRTPQSCAGSYSDETM